jgi:hypothetical protein
MRCFVWIGTLAVALIAGGRGLSAEAPRCCEPPQGCFLERIGPVGGWCPYGGGLLSWWNKHCFPCTGGPDDYCRKPLPVVCWPHYPSFYIWGPPEECPSRDNCGRGAAKEPH